MLINNANFFILILRINRFVLPLAVLPFRCLSEIIDDVANIIYVFTRKTSKARIAVDTVESLIMDMADYGRFDFVDIDATQKDNRFKIKIMTR